jgi:hypothetical protein
VKKASVNGVSQKRRLQKKNTVVHEKADDILDSVQRTVLAEDVEGRGCDRGRPRRGLG